MTTHQGWFPFFVTIRTLATSILLISCAAEYAPKTITDTPGYTLLAGVSHVPAPVVVSPDQQGWGGIDGAWNTFSVRVGSQEQNVSVLVSTTNQQVWAVNAQACTADVLSSLPEVVSQMSLGQCENSRGFLFNTSQSDTWSETGYYSLQTPDTSSADAVGLYGLDRVGLRLSDGEEGPTISNTTVGTIGTHATLATPEFWLGRIGLQSNPSVFALQPSRSSYITGLFDMQGIPSQSFGYTAGAKYRENGTTPYHGSLILGGYDASRFSSNSMVFRPDTERNLVVGLAGLTAKTTSVNNIDLLNGTNVDLHIDSNVAEIWLPVNVCKAFEEAFGLIYDEMTDLYLVDNILHQRLSELNPSITFTLRQAASTSAAGTVEVTLPYGAFDLEASPPYQSINETSRYFPLRRGSNETQWTIGRTFLQEAYLTVDWERSEFHVYPCDWNGRASDIVAIVSPRYGKAVGGADETPSRLSTAAIVGISIGVVAVVLLAIVIAWRVWRRQLQRKANATNSSPAASKIPGPNTTEGSRNSSFPPVDHGPLVFAKAELPGESNVGNNRDPFTDANAIEQPIYEMMGDIPITEAGGRQLSEKESMIVRERNINGIDPNGTPTLTPPHTASRSAPVSSMDEVAITNRMSGHHRASVSTGAARCEGSSGLPPYQAQQEDAQSQDRNRRRFSYES